MDFFETIEQRRSVRKYKTEDVPKEVLDKALDAALKAPNSSNMQPWEFYVVKTPEIRAELSQACLSQSSAKTADTLVVAVARIDTWRRNQKLMLEHFKKIGMSDKTVLNYYKKIMPFMYNQGFLSTLGMIKGFALNVVGLFRPMPRGPFSKDKLFGVLVKTTALACQNFMNAMTAQGYGTCPMEGFDEVRVKKILNLGRDAKVVMVISCGVIDRAGIYGDRIRFDKDLFVKYL